MTFQGLATGVDIAWVVLCSVLVFLMQAGFLCLETGLTRAKNSINVALKNLTDFGLSALIFWALGAGLMFGTTRGGWLGTDWFAPSLGEHREAAFMFFQVMFCGTSVTIVSGAVAERMRFAGYLIVVALQSGIVYTLYGHWAWGGLAQGKATGWLAERGFVDFAGSSVVHSVGGWVSLAAAILIGARKGRFTAEGRANRITGSSLPMSMLGALLLWVGWFGFNGGSTLALNDQVPGIVVNTALAASSGMITALFVGWPMRRRPDVGFVINGTLAGLVAVTASCHAVTAASALLIGAIGAVVAIGVELLLEKLRIDDVVGAVPVHLGAGVWGTLAVGIFGMPERLGTGLGAIGQIAAQLQGIAVCFIWSFGLMYLLLWLINRIYPLRVTEEAERVGLNVSEHNETTELLDLFRAMDEQAKNEDITRRIPVEPFTEVGQIATYYNKVLDALQKALARTQLIVQNAFDGIVTFAAGSLTIERLNPSAEAMFGYPEAQIVGQPIGRLFHAPDGDGIKPGQRELAGRRADGSTFPMEMVVTEIAEGDQSFFTGTFRDITQRKRVEETLRTAKEAAESANQLKSQFLASMSHELRTPLNAIIGYSEMLQEEAADSQQQAFLPDLGKIHGAGRHLLRVINDLLDFSKIEAGKLDLYLETFDILTLTKEVAATLEPMVTQNKNSFAMRVADGTGQMHADTTRIRQCLFNLLSNASKFAQGKSVSLEVEPLSRGGREMIVFRIRDGGIGMTPEQLARLFQPFTQADASTTRRYGGTGLGLAVSQRFCRMMGGEITVASTPGQGSTFTMEIPRKVVPRALDVDQARWDGAAPSYRPVPDTDTSRGTILAIDDDNAVLDLIDRFLSREGFRVITARSGAEGLRLAKEVRPRLITLDVVMPGMDGWTVLRNLKADPQLSEIPVIIVTMTDDMGKGFALGATKFLNKPIDRARLIEVLERLTPRAKPQSVLIVEDDPDSREMLDRLLRHEGWHVTVAENGRQALEQIAERIPDLILLDLMMPEMNGFELVSILRQNANWRGIPVVVITAKELTPQDRAQLEGHVAAVFQKGALSRDDLMRELRDLLDVHLTASA